MDIDLFSDMVKGLILDNDEVTLPGLGTFVSEVMPSTFSDKGYTINPPYRKLSFRQRGSGNEEMMAEFYAKINGTDLETSKRILGEFIAGLRTTLQAKKVVIFPGLGRLRATKENTFFFIADEDLDIYPYGVGLEPVSLKTHEETPDEVAQSVAALRELVADPVPIREPIAPVAELVEAADVTGDDAAKESLRQARRPEEKTERREEAVAQPEKAEEYREESISTETHIGKKRGWKVAAVVAASVVGVALLALGIFILLAHIAPDFIDSILYTPEELRIINH